MFLAPKSFNGLLGMAKGIISERTLKSIKVLGENEAEWKRYLAERIDQDQLYEQYGGSKKM